MSSAHPGDAPSPRPERPGAADGEPSLAATVRLRGAALLEALEEHLPGAREHGEATASYAFAAAVELGFDRHAAEALREVAKLHEVGRVYVPAALLRRPAAELSRRERERVASHHEAGARLARGAAIPEEACAWIALAAERFDGAGPAGLRADAIPIESRAIRAACACDTELAAPGAGGIGARRAAAVAALRDAAGGELDPGVVEALAAVLERAAD